MIVTDVFDVASIVSHPLPSGVDEDGILKCQAPVGSICVSIVVLVVSISRKPEVAIVRYM